MMVLAFTHVRWIWTEEEDRLQTRLARIMIESVKRVMPGLEIWQLTDRETPKVRGVDQVMREDNKTEWWSDWANGMFKEMNEVSRETIFLDTDCVVKKDLRTLFQKGFDVLMTAKNGRVVYYEDPQGKRWVQPFNLGVCLSRSPEFWDEIGRRVAALPDPALRAWWGTQATAYQMYKESTDESYQGRKYNFRVLPMDPYNYAPMSEDEDPETLEEKWVVHYKGRRRKAWMLKHEHEHDQAVA